jgi:hypothetical protein
MTLYVQFNGLLRNVTTMIKRREMLTTGENKARTLIKALLNDTRNKRNPVTSTIALYTSFNFCCSSWILISGLVDTNVEFIYNDL